MNIKQAKNLKIGDTVGYPEDKGEPAGIGKVRGLTGAPRKAINNEEYLWVALKNASNKTVVWPSNRLTKRNQE